MDNKVPLGALVQGEQSRDAIHIAVAPVVAGARLRPGDHVGLLGGGEAVPHEEPVGVVDPFLRDAVEPGQRFWLLLYPYTITSLRHEWRHPAFGALDATKISHEDHAAKSRAWIEQHARAMGLSEDVLMENAREWLHDNSAWPDYFVQLGSERWRDTFDATEFWHHFEVVTRTVVPEEKKTNPYCCTC
jgi:hypothetical protein